MDRKLTTWPSNWDGTTLAPLCTWLAQVFRQLKDGIPYNREGHLDSFYTPYQFVLPLLQDLYYELIHLEKPQALALDPVELERWSQNAETGREVPLGARNPRPRTVALELSLRAVVFLSWEPESRVFLVRRVYPTYFDFLAISHIPEGWGASSVMFGEFEDRMTDGIATGNGDFYTLVDPDDERYRLHTLRYVAEKERLNYREVAVVPVFARGKESCDDTDLLGAYLLFFGDRAHMPATDSDTGQRLREAFLKPLCEATAEIVVLHNELLDYPGSIDAQLLALRRARGRAARVAEVRIGALLDARESEQGGSVEKATRNVLRALAGPDFYAVSMKKKKDRPDTPGETILVVARHGIDTDQFRKRLLRLLLDKLSEGNVQCQVSIEEYEPRGGAALLLLADGTWGA